jgi:hypothetical protein
MACVTTPTVREAAEAVFLEEPESRMHTQEREQLLPGRVSQTDITLCRLPLRYLCQFLHEEMYERGLRNQDALVKDTEAKVAVDKLKAKTKSKRTRSCNPGEAVRAASYILR